MRNHWKTLYSVIIDVFYRAYFLLVRHLPFNKLYQPVYGMAENHEGAVVRGCLDRWVAMAPHLETCLAKKGGNGALLDIGCNIGYFSFSAAKAGYNVHGVEADPIYISTCNSIKYVKQIDNAHFIKSWITPDYIKGMPSYDAVINLSVFHHWVKAYGAETAQNMMRGLAAKCSLLVFETGQPDELGTKWAKKLNFMGNDPVTWITDFLKEIGFDNVEVIGEHTTGLTEVKRALFVAGKTV